MLEIDYSNFNASVPQIQCLAAVIQQMMDEEFCLENSKLLTFIQIPSNFKNWDEFNDYCQRNSSDQIKIKTKLYGDVVYEALHLNKVQPSVFFVYSYWFFTRVF